MNAQCTNTDGSYTCGCLNGYSGDGKNCTGKRLCGAVSFELVCFSLWTIFFSCIFYTCFSSIKIFTPTIVS